MTTKEWPAPPDLLAGDAQAEVKKILYQAQLDAIKSVTGDKKWPALPDIVAGDSQAELKKMLYQAQLDAHKAELATKLALDKARVDAGIESAKRESTADIEREKAVLANEFVQAQALNAAYLEIAKGALDRATARATFVQGAAAAISGAYAGVLGLSFVASAGTPLPARGIAPAFFLGLAIFLAAAYVSFLTRPDDVRVPPAAGTLYERQRQRRNQFVLWTRTSVLRRRRLLQASVVSLGVGVLLLPLPFLQVSGTAVWKLVIGGSLAILVLPMIVASQLRDDAE